jgi:hypothetical protein
MGMNGLVFWLKFGFLVADNEEIPYSVGKNRGVFQ